MRLEFGVREQCNFRYDAIVQLFQRQGVRIGLACLVVAVCVLDALRRVFGVAWGGEVPAVLLLEFPYPLLRKVKLFATAKLGPVRKQKAVLAVADWLFQGFFERFEGPRKGDFLLGHDAPTHVWGKAGRVADLELVRIEPFAVFSVLLFVGVVHVFDFERPGSNTYV